ncbi:MAG: c-type cytochrome [Burkholderiales bacterium]|jgi:cytochrome subunit of sulfide dehydrogenase|nr:c-type cytochrome [Burkholderiales bacterium]
MPLHRRFALAGRLAPLVLALTVLAPAQSALAQDATALGRHVSFTCTNCHGTNGMSVGGMPSLAGQDRGYLARQMRDFRDGKRPATVMHQLARGLTDEQIDAVSAHFAAIKPAPAAR